MILGIWDFIQKPFGYLIKILYDVTSSYGLALILFAIIVKVVLLPATAKAKKSSMKMSRISPLVKQIQEKYADDPQRQSAEMQELYKREGVSLGGSCLWSLVPLFVLIPLYSVIRFPIEYMLGQTTEVANAIVAEMQKIAPNLITAGNEQITAAANMGNHMAALKEALPNLSADVLKGIDFTFLGIDLGAIPSFNVFSKTFWNWPTVGAFLIPVLSAASQLVSMLVSQKLNNSVVTDENGIYDEETAKNSQANQQSKTMMWVMPLISLWIGFSIPGALSLYWFAQGVVSLVSDVWLTNKYRKIYDAEDAVKLRNLQAQQALEAEKEQIRAERRAANPDGITTNTSKKKMQAAKQAQKEAEQAAAAKEYAARKGIVEEEAPQNTAMSGIAERPYCKGRNYDPNRYKEN